MGIVIDIESDGFVFESTKIWTIHALDTKTGERFSTNPFKNVNAKKELIDFIFKDDLPQIIFHNGLGFDIFVLRHLLDLDFTVGPDTIEGLPVQYIDTFYLSMFLNPDREGHSIAYFGEKLGFPKMDYRQELIDLGELSEDSENGEQFKSYHPLMETYCSIDVDVGSKVFQYLKQEWRSVYESDFTITDAFKCGQKAFFLMSCQELTGWKFDVDAATKLKVRIGGMMEEIRAVVEPQLPPRPLKKGEQKEYTMPAKPFLKNGEYSSHMLKFIEKHNGVIKDGVIEFYGKDYEVVGGNLLDVKLPMQMANQDQMKDFFLESGWVPTFFNYKRGPDGKPMRDPVTRQLIPTTPKIQEQGRICPNLEAMEGDLVTLVVKWLSLRNRQSVLQGWLDNPRLQYDGRIGAGRTGIASTHRQKHKVVVNVPKASDKVLLGHEFRSLWIAEDGMLIAAGDAAALEGRVQGHYCWRYDQGVTAKELLDGDIHCFSEDTEILTEEGWKKFNEIGEGKVAQWESGRISFVKPKEIIWTDYQGEMISFESQSISKLVTPNHRILLNNLKTKKDYVVLAKEVSEKNSNTRIYTAGKEKGGVKLDPTLAELIVAIQSDAYLTETAVRFEFTKERKVARIKKLLEGLGVTYNESQGKGGRTTRFYVNKGHLKGALQWLDEDKNLSWKLTEIDGESSKVILESYGIWDGTFTKNGDIVLDTTSSKTIDVLQALASFCFVKTTVTRKIEKKTTFGTTFVDRIYISNKTEPFAGTRNAKTVQQYSGKIGCVVVDSGFIVVRKDCSVCISGNSKTAKSVYEDKLKDFDITSPDFNKDDPVFKPYRDRSKNVYYACLPMQTKVLTKQGWKLFDEISVGEKILSFNEETGVVEEDVVLNKHFFKDKEVLHYSNKYDSFQCTEEHRWYGYRRSKTRGKQSKKIFGYFEANQITQEHNIILTAPWVGSGESSLTDDECSLLGWLASDGYWKWSEKGLVTSSMGGKKKGIVGCVYQSEKKFVKEIEELFKNLGLELKVTPSGCKETPVNMYTIQPEFLRGLVRKAFGNDVQKHEADWVKLVLSMTRSNLESFYGAFYKGDGHVKSGSEIVSQNDGNISDAVVTAMQLLGKGRVSLSKKKGSNFPMKDLRVQKRKHITCQEIVKTSLGVQDTFCLTTKNSSFIIWQDNFIGITGNCLYGAGDTKLAATAGLPESRGKQVSEAFWKANEGTKKLKDALEKYWESRGKKKYLPAIDGRILITRKKSALLNTIFQSCGGIVMDYACCFMDSWLGKIYWDDKRRPYYLYKGYVVRRIGYFHDEAEYECEAPVAEEVSKMIEKAIKKAGQYLKLNVELAGEGKYGLNWKETH